MKKVCYLVALILPSHFVFAQPTDADIKKNITQTGVKSVNLASTPGRRQWNSSTGNWEWVKNASRIRNSDYTGIDLKEEGDVVYQYTGSGKYSFQYYRVFSKEYIGIPNPSQKEIIDLISSDWKEFYQFYFGTITKEYFTPTLADQPKWFWHSPKSVEFYMKLKFDHITSNTTLETLETKWKLRLYRDDLKGPWKSFMTTRTEEKEDNTVVGTKTISFSEMQELKKKTLEFTINENKAKNQKEAGPKVNPQSFSNAEEMARYLHQLLCTGTKEQFKSAMLQLLGPDYFESGSSVQLKYYKGNELDEVINRAFSGSATYKLMFCENQKFKTDTWADGEKQTVNIPGVTQKSSAIFEIAPVKKGYKDGVPQKELRIVYYAIMVSDSQDDIDYVNSFSDRKKLCGGN